MGPTTLVPTRSLPFLVRPLLAMALICLALAGEARAEERWAHGDYDVVQWTSADGLPSNVVRALAQTPDGFLWIGTWGGLARFDGWTFETFDLTTTPELGGTAITCLAVDGEGTLWIGAHGGFVTRYRSGVFTSIPPRLSPNLRALEVDAAGTLWAGGRGLALLEDGRLQSVADTHVWAMQTGPGGGVWIAGTDGVHEVRRDPQVVPQVTLRDDRRASGLARLPEGGLLAQLEADDALVRIPGKRHFADTPPGPHPWGDWHLWDSATARDGACWLAYGAGLYRLSATAVAADRVTWGPRLLALPRERTGPTRAVIQNTDGDVCVGTDGKGLLVLSPRRSRRVGGHDLGPLVPMADGSLWTTVGGVPTHLDDRARTQETLTTFPGAHVSRARGGGIWITREDGYVRLRDDATERFGLPASVGKAFRPILEDSRGRLWWTAVGSRITGIEEGRAVYEGPGRVLAEGRDGAPWVLLPDGRLGRVRGKEFDLVHRDLEQGLGLHEDAAERVWIATKGHGLILLDGGRETRLTTAHGLPHNVLGHIVADDQDRLWINSNAGLFVARAADLVAVADGAQDRALCRLVTRIEAGYFPSAWGPDGQLYVSTIEGYQRVDTNALEPLSDSPATQILGLLAGGRPRVAAPEIELGTLTRGFTVRYTAPSLRGADLLEFRYHLEGLDRGWSRPEKSRRAHYHDLRPGDYTFSVAARYPGGSWGTPASLRLSLPAQVHEKAWFRGALLFGLGTVALSIFLYRSRAARAGRRARVAELEWHRSQESRRRLARRLLTAEERERRRIALELHDGVNQKIALLSLELTTRPDALEDHIESLRGLSLDVHHISHALHPARLEQLGLAAALRGVAGEVEDQGDLAIDFEASGHTEDLEDEAALCLFRIGQEALFNAQRHSAANHAWVHLEGTASEVRLRIRDDGQGFDPKSVAPRGLGLKGMAERAEMAGGAVTIVSTPGTGTTIEAHVPRVNGRS